MESNPPTSQAGGLNPAVLKTHPKGKSYFNGLGVQVDTEQPTRALGYVRRSKRSEERTVSLEEQERQVRAYCEAQDFEFVGLVRDDGISGTKRVRLDRITKALNSFGAKIVVVYHLDRFARDIAGLLEHLKQYHRDGIELHVCERGKVEIHSPTGFLTVGVEALLAEHYSKLISAKTRDALASLKAKGRRISGRIPYGWKLATDGISLIADPHEQEIRDIIFKLNRDGHGPRAIVRMLYDRQIKARGGRGFSPSTIYQLLRSSDNERPQIEPNCIGPPQKENDLPHVFAGSKTS